MLKGVPTLVVAAESLNSVVPEGTVLEGVGGPGEEAQETVKPAQVKHTHKYYYLLDL